MSAFIPMQRLLPNPDAVDVCPHCKRQLTRYRFHCEAHSLDTWHCPEHGDVVPMRSIVFQF